MYARMTKFVGLPPERIDQALVAGPRHERTGEEQPADRDARAGHGRARTLDRLAELHLDRSGILLGNDAPIEPTLDGQRIRIPGFVIPLERAGNKISEFHASRRC